MRPQDYSARTAYRPPTPLYRRLNRIGILLTSLGLAPRRAVTLVVTGRVTGRDRRSPVLLTGLDGDDYIVSLAGESEWVRNIRASAGSAKVVRRRRRRVQLDEISESERAPILAAYLDSAGAGSDRSRAEQARFYFGLDADATTDDFAGIAAHYPVFRVRYPS